MGIIISILTSAIILVILIMRVKRNNILKSSVRLTKEILAGYVDIFKGHMLLKGSINAILIVFAVIFTFTYVNKLIDIYIYKFSDASRISIKVVTSTLIVILIFYAIGYVLLIFARVNKFIRKTEDKQFKFDLVLSYFIISTYLAVMLIFPDDFAKVGIVVLISVIISYLIDMRLLFNLMRNPFSAKSKKEDNLSYGRIIAAALLVLVMIILDFYLASCSLYVMYPHAYAHVSGYFGLFYYTIISFTTVGYGDIVPLIRSTRILAIVISVTSVICLTIFLSSILSYKDKY